MPLLANINNRPQYASTFQFGSSLNTGRGCLSGVIAEEKLYSDGISFTGVDGVMPFYHRTSVILMADSHGIRNLSKTIRSGRGNSIYVPPSPACRDVRFMLLPE